MLMLPRIVLLIVLLLLPPMGTAAGVDGYVGSAACAPCHEAETAAWRGSDHDRAMQVASEASVLGRFDGSEVVHGASRARFFRRDGKYWIHTDGPDGQPADFEVRYTFGVRPLQQYLLALPGGRLHASVFAWDSRARQDGGQRWFRLQPDEPMPAGDVMHWTGISQSWNSMCADCHSTAYRKNYSVADGTYAPEWAEIDVACEACHGPGEAHVRWANTEPRAEVENAALSVDLRGDGAAWTMNPETGIAGRSKPPTGSGELDTCAPCHARRSALVAEPEPGGNFLDAYVPALIEDGLYFPDGQIRDEVFVWGSFVQSRMHAAGVRCGDCHDPHSLEVRGGTAAVCFQCHSAAKFGTKAHHGHPPGSPGSRCVDCHMPERTYMEVDARRDHSFRVPRPDLSAALGVPNPCTTCHLDRDARWSAAAIRDWRGGSPPPDSFADVIARAWAGDATVVSELARVAGEGKESQHAAIVRASAVAALAAFPGPEAARALAQAARSEDALVRFAAARAAARLPEGDRYAVAAPLLEDPVRAVRAEAGVALVRSAWTEWPESERRTLLAAVDEYRKAQLVYAERPNSHVNLGNLAAAMRDAAAAERSYRTAIAVGDYFIPAFVNLADLQRALGREADAEATLRAGIARHPEAADLRYALGLSLVRSGRSDEALEELKRAVLAAPENAGFAYGYGVALHSTGNVEKAIDVLTAALDRHPRSLRILEALAAFHRDRGDLEKAQRYFVRLQSLAGPTAGRP